MAEQCVAVRDERKITSAEWSEERLRQLHADRLDACMDVLWQYQEDLFVDSDFDDTAIFDTVKPSVDEWLQGKLTIGQLEDKLNTMLVACYKAAGEEVSDGN
jgi:hypothetical protein